MIATLEAEKKGLLETTSHLQHEIENFSQRVQTLSTHIKTYEQTLQDERQQNERLLSEKEAQLNEQNVKYLHLSQQYQTLQSQLDSLKEQLHFLQTTSQNEKTLQSSEQTQQNENCNNGTLEKRSTNFDNNNNNNNNNNIPTIQSTSHSTTVLVSDNVAQTDVSCPLLKNQNEFVKKEDNALHTANDEHLSNTDPVTISNDLLNDIDFMDDHPQTAS
jgi:DNA repair exonuclease SbcCD ATPase subunit